jgi:hypothetical protein
LPRRAAREGNALTGLRAPTEADITRADKIAVSGDDTQKQNQQQLRKFGKQSNSVEREKMRMMRIM